MEQTKRPVEQYYYSEDEWNRLGYGLLPPERNRVQQLQNVMAKGNSTIDSKAVKVYN